MEKLSDKALRNVVGGLNTPINNNRAISNGLPAEKNEKYADFWGIETDGTENKKTDENSSNPF